MQKVDFVEVSPGNNGLVATEDIEEEDDLMFVPEHWLLKEVVAERSKIYQVLAENEFEGYDSGIAYTVYLLEQSRVPNSYWKNYLNILPKDFSEFPLFWSDEDLEWLKGSTLQKAIQNRRKGLENDYK